MSYDQHRFINNLTKLLGINFELKNEFLDTENIFPGSAQKSLSYEDLDGNPLQIDYIVNLSSIFSDNTDIYIKIPAYTSVFNLHNFKTIMPCDFNDSYKNIIKLFSERKRDDSPKFSNYAYMISQKMLDVRGYAQCSKDHLYYLKINRVNKLFKKDTQKLRISELVDEPRFKNTHKYVDVLYLFRNGQFSVRWKNSYNVFDWPEPTSECDVTITNSTNTETSLHNIKAELEQLKILYKACEDDKVEWDAFLPNQIIKTEDEFKQKLENFLQKSDTLASMNDKSEVSNQRDMDISEHLWCICKNITNKKLFKQCISTILLPTLQSNFSLVRFGSTNPTEFHRMLCNRFLKSESRLNALLANIELLVEVGLYKLTSDLLFIIKSDLPSISQAEQSKLMNACCKVENLQNGIDSLNHLFNVINYIDILKQFLIPGEFKNQACITIRNFIQMLEQTAVPIQINRNFTTKISNIQTNLKTLCCYWAAHFFSETPVKSHKVVVFEVENHEGNLELLRHDLELAEIKVYA